MSPAPQGSLLASIRPNLTFQCTGDFKRYLRLKLVGEGTASAVPQRHPTRKICHPDRSGPPPFPPRSLEPALSLAEGRTCRAAQWRDPGLIAAIRESMARTPIPKQNERRYSAPPFPKPVIPSTARDLLFAFELRPSAALPSPNFQFLFSIFYLHHPLQPPRRPPRTQRLPRHSVTNSAGPLS
jgi:hypothetical protein